MRKLIFTGDDFGLSVSVNEAIEEAHRDGTLTTASLMMGAEATADAVERARRILSLRIGLHLVLVDGSPVLPPQEIPNLVDRRGKFSCHLVGAGVRFFFRPGVRKQLEQEIRAQFRTFRETGLPLDHVNTHHHMHLHPTVLGLILKVGKEYGMRAVRLPYEPLFPSWRAPGKAFLRKMSSWLFLSPWCKLLKSRLKHANIRSNQFIFGMNDSGHMDPCRLHQILRNLPKGVTEIYFHPSARRCLGMDGGGPDRDPCGELEALTSPGIRKLLETLDIQRIGFSDL